MTSQGDVKRAMPIAVEDATGNAYHFPVSIRGIRPPKPYQLMSKAYVLKALDDDAFHSGRDVSYPRIPPGFTAIGPDDARKLKLPVFYKKSSFDTPALLALAQRS